MIDPLTTACTFFKQPTGAITMDHETARLAKEATGVKVLIQIGGKRGEYWNPTPTDPKCRVRVLVPGDLIEVT
jgi:hypothetical protein